jgi:hypothetical protein
MAAYDVKVHTVWLWNRTTALLQLDVETTLNMPYLVAPGADFETGAEAVATERQAIIDLLDYTFFAPNNYYDWVASEFEMTWIAARALVFFRPTSKVRGTNLNTDTTCEVLAEDIS